MDYSVLYQVCVTSYTSNARLSGASTSFRSSSPEICTRQVRALLSCEKAQSKGHGAGLLLHEMAN